MKHVTTILFALVITAPTVASAQEDGEQPAASEQLPADGEQQPDAGEQQPAVFHRPTLYAQGGKDAPVYAQVAGDWKLDRVFLAYRPAADSAADYTEVDFERASADEFVAVIPAEAMQPPGVDYFIASESDGEPSVHFASANAPQQTIVIGETDKTREQRRLARHDGKRSEFELSGEYTDWGRRAVNSSGELVSTDPNTDWMWESTLQYRYRFLTNPYEIAFGLGVIRGNLDTLTTEGGTVVANPIPDLSGGRPGMNYGWGQLTWEFHRNFSVDARLLFGASAIGFAAGFGGIARIGRIGGTRLEFGGEAFQDIGSLGFMSFHWDTLPRLPMGLTFEFSNRPNPGGTTGTRLMYDIGVEFSDAITVVGTVGVPIRNAATAAGLMGGLDLKYAF